MVKKDNVKSRHGREGVAMVATRTRDDQETLYALGVSMLAMQIRVLQVQHRERSFDDIVADVCGELEVDVEFPEVTA